MKGDYGRCMETHRPESEYRGFDAQVGALLDRVQQSASFVDSLMAMPVPEEGAAPPEWDAAVARRLERRLVENMRAILDPQQPERQRA